MRPIVQPAVLPLVYATAIDIPTLPFARVTPELVTHIFPQTPLAHIQANLPPILAALIAAGLTDTLMLLAALGTIRAEAESFQPLTERPSLLNTSPGGQPFDLYDHRVELGNQGPPDGARFCGRGFVQLTGRANYAHYGTCTDLPLVSNPDLAAQSGPAATLLARFLSDRQQHIRGALASGDLSRARRLVNGGSNGLDRFVSAVTLGTRLLG